MGDQSETQVICVGELNSDDLARMAERFGLRLVGLADGQHIPGSFWGAPEAGLVGDKIYVRPDTPAHSLLHELCHFVCMSGARRAALDTDAGGDYDEENAVCYLQILLSDWCPGLGRARILRDMDSWGYSFRMGTAQAWFQTDASEARDWLRAEGLVDAQEQPTWRLRY